MKNDLITFKKIYRLLEDSNLSFLIDSNETISVTKIIYSLKKADFVKDFCFILTEEKVLSFGDLIKLIKRFFNEVNLQKAKAQPLYDRLSQIKFKDSIKTDLSTNNIYLEMQYQLTKRGFTDLNEITLDEGAYILLQEALIDKAQERKMEKNAKGR